MDKFYKGYIMKKVLLFGLFVLLCFPLLAAGGRARDEGPFTLRFGHVLSPLDLPHIHMMEWSENVRAATNGGLNIEIFPSAQLGSEEDVLEQIRQGANIGWQTDFARLGSYLRELSVPNASYFVSNLDEAMRLLESPTLRRLNNELAERFNIANISFIWSQGERHVFANRIARSPDEMRGMLIRTAPAPIWVESVNALGVTATPLPFAEIYTAISGRVVDGAEVGFSAGMNLRLAEVTRYVMETGHIFLLNTMVVSQSWLNRLPTEYQRILIEEANRAGMNSSRAHIARNEEARQELVRGGITVIPREQLDIEAFRRASQQAYDALGLTDVRNAIHAEIGRR
jgi:TRAP-type C4-dicarboxylate transport system substrate-binding protein